MNPPMNPNPTTAAPVPFQPSRIPHRPPHSSVSSHLPGCSRRVGDAGGYDIAAQLPPSAKPAPGHSPSAPGHARSDPTHPWGGPVQPRLVSVQAGHLPRGAFPVRAAGAGGSLLPTPTTAPALRRCGRDTKHGLSSSKIPL